ncbi:GNAT family N-acetyltransferase [Nocardioides kribbensis]|uniref:GNAT family N-acetyltransferase n=1 Tax=Nocardioides kribbensis TaxID=305517 RepID=UPI0018796635|nr:GNAT family N-acetyltransferase [Nocardioides kribbensis]
MAGHAAGPGPHWTLRRARDEDLPAVGEVTLAAYAPFTRGPDDPYVARLGDAGPRHREAELWVAVGPAGRVLGSVTVCPPGSPWREVARDGEGEFRMLAVDPAAHGSGVGRALVRHAVDRARELGAGAVVISSLTAMTTAHRLYETLGFVRDPGRDWRPLPEVDLIAYRLEP